MKSYTQDFERETHAFARIEGVDASYKDLAQVCGRIRGKDAQWSLVFLDKASKGDIPVLYKAHNKRLGHRKELGGRKGRYPKKAAAIVAKALKSAMANGLAKGLGMSYKIVHVCANKQHTYPRLASKGRQARSNYEISRVEVILKGTEEIPKGVEVKNIPMEKEKSKETSKQEEKKTEVKKEEKKVEKKSDKPKEDLKKEISEKKVEAPKKEEKKVVDKKPEPPKSDVKKPEVKA